MADDNDVDSDDDGVDDEPCTVQCTAIIGRDSNDDPIRCSNKCGKPNSIAHQSYGEHKCKDHR